MKRIIIAFSIISILLGSGGCFQLSSPSFKVSRDEDLNYEYLITNNCNTDVFFRVGNLGTESFTYNLFIPQGGGKEGFIVPDELVSIRFEVEAMKSNREHAGYMLNYQELSPITMKDKRSSKRDVYNSILCGAKGYDFPARCELGYCFFDQVVFSRENWVDHGASTNNNKGVSESFPPHQIPVFNMAFLFDLRAH